MPPPDIEVVKMAIMLQICSAVFGLSSLSWFRESANTAGELKWGPSPFPFR